MATNTQHISVCFQSNKLIWSYLISLFSSRNLSRETLVWVVCRLKWNILEAMLYSSEKQQQREVTKGKFDYILMKLTNWWSREPLHLMCSHHLWLNCCNIILVLWKIHLSNSDGEIQKFFDLSLIILLLKSRRTSISLQ